MLMNTRILLIDDDADFNELLTDVFSQTDHEIVSLRDPAEAVERIRTERFDLVVTDRNMPNITGEQIIKELRAVDPAIPVIMVSGYLDPDVVRSLVADGVNGVFQKPLNVFGLLKHANKLIDERRETDQESLPAAADFDPGLGFPFYSFACKAPKAMQFATALHAASSFRSSLVLIGEVGTQFLRIAADIRNLSRSEDEAILAIDPEFTSTQDFLDAVLGEAGNGIRQVLVVVLRTADMTGDLKQALISLSQGRGPFEPTGVSARFVFCVTEDVETMYDKGQIDEELYILLGTTELTVPPLKDCHEDIPILAQRLIGERLGESPPSVRISRGGCAFLSEQTWPGGFDQLDETIAIALDNLDGKTLSRDDLHYAYHNKAKSPHRMALVPLKPYLLARRNDFVAALAGIYRNDISKVAHILAVDEALVTGILGTRKGSLLDQM